MIQASYEGVATLQTTDAPVSADVKVRLRRWQRLLITIGSLVLIYGVGFGVMIAGGAVVHGFDRKKHLDTFSVFHNLWVVGVLLGIAVLWLLPPNPWAKRAVESGPPEQPAKAEGDGPGVVTVQLELPVASEHDLLGHAIR